MDQQYVYEQIQAGIQAVVFEVRGGTDKADLVDVRSLGDALIIRVRDGTEFVLTLERLTEGGAPSTQIGDPLPATGRLLREPGGRD